MVTVHKVNPDGSEQIMFGKVIVAEKPVRKRAHRTGWKPSRELLRLREIEKVIKYRHGSMIPDPEDTDDRETCLDYIKAAALSLSDQDMADWCRKWAPWVKDHELAAITSIASTRRRMMTADGAAGLIRLTWADRTRLGIRTIGACDVPKDERMKLAKERKRERDRNRKAEARKANGVKDRASYEAQSLSTLKPWKDLGMSRAKWYRTRETSPSRIEVIGNGDTPVSRRNGDTLVQSFGGLPPTPPPVSKPRADGEAVRRAGLGDHPPAEFQEAGPHGNGDTLSEEAA